MKKILMLFVGCALMMTGCEDDDSGNPAQIESGGLLYTCSVESEGGVVIEASAGQNLDLSLQVRNISDQAVLDYNDEPYFFIFNSADEKVWSNEGENRAAVVPQEYEMSPGAVKNYSRRWQVPADLPSGPYVMEAVKLGTAVYPRYYFKIQ